MGRLDLFFGKKVKENTTLNKNEMSKEKAYAVPYTNRRAWSDFSVLESLTPERLATILKDVRSGECPAEYLELAQDMELKDLHYRSVISTRKDAVCGLDIQVVPSSEDKKDIEIAEAVRRDIVENPTASLRTLYRNMLDSLSKGFAVNEIMWDTTGKTWKPKTYEWKDARWFQYDKDTGKHLMLRDPLSNELYPLAANKFIIFEPHLISGTQIISGLALPALFYFMLKSYDITSWAAFIDRYGFPIRLGKYGKKATEEDIKTLKRAIAAIGADFGAVIPESALIEIIESKNTGDTSEAYQKMAVWIDKQISKLVLGQTMTTDEGSSRAQSQTHEEVRDDIADSDLEQLNDCLNSQLVVPYIKFNFGAQEFYTRVQLYKPDTKSIEQIVNAIEKLGPQGLKVPADEVRELLGFSKPKEGEETIGGMVNVLSMNDSEGLTELNAVQLTHTNRTESSDPVDELLDEMDNDYIEITEDIVKTFEQAAEKASDFEGFKANLEKQVIEWEPEKTAELMALAFFKGRVHGDVDFDKDIL